MDQQELVEHVQVLLHCFVAESSFPTLAAKWKLLDCDGNSWDMYSMTNKHNQVTLHRKHWAQFSLHHFLEDGDVCVFDLKEEDALAIVVHIFRVLPISMCDKNSVHAHYKMREINAT
ncbi:hypothetical protein M758_UG141200 [Ceratodon purpureus]|nr:hypothetical protein M758_UG141200 [Ceratodon purpureus]